MSHAYLSTRALLRLSGEDTLEFLQGLVSNDVRTLATGACVYAAMLSPQGKFLHDFFLISTQGGVLIDCAQDGRDDLFKRLSLYKLRSKVTIEKVDELAVAAVFGEVPEPAQGLCIMADPRVPALGFRVVAEKALLEKWQDREAYERLRIRLCVPDTRDMIFDKSLLLEFGFEELRGVDFTKGCYVGQEVTARSKHRGQVRKFIYSVRANDGSALPQPGTQIYAGDTVIGELRTSSGDMGIALLRVEEVEKQPVLRCGNAAISAALPMWHQ